MRFELKAGAETEGLPTITLAGESYFIARQPLRHRIAAAMLLPKIRSIIGRLPKEDEVSADTVVTFDEADYMVLVDFVRHGLAPLYPDITREALLDAPIEFEELFAAWPVVLAQGASRRHAAGEV